jgi:hypothetical protein
MEIVRREERHFRAQLGIRQRISSQRAQVVIPQSREKDVLLELHSGPLGGNLGINKTTNKARQMFYWLQAISDIEK